MKIKHNLIHIYLAGAAIMAGFQLANGQNYTYSIVGQTGQSGITGILGGPALNDSGECAFAVQVSEGESIFAGDGSGNPTLVADLISSTRAYSPYLRINNNDEIVAQDRLSGDPLTFMIRTWNADTPGAFKIVAIGVNGSDVATPSINNSGQVAYLGFDGSNYYLYTTNTTGPHFYYQAALNNNVFSPMIADNGSIVGKVGSVTTSGSIRVYNSTLASYVDVAAAGVGSQFTSLDSLPGISEDGQVVAFYGSDANGPGIFIVTAGAAGFAGSIAYKIAGSGNGFSSFQALTRVAVKTLPNQPGAGNVAYIGTQDGVTGLYLTSFESQGATVPPVVNPATAVVTVGQSVTDLSGLTSLSGTVAGLAIQDPLNINGDVAFVVETSEGIEAVVEAIPTLTPPDITEQPIDRIVIHGSNVVFSVEAIGEEPIMYQWQFNGMNLVDDMEGHINGSITDTLEIDDVGTNDAGSYSVVVSHGDVSTNSDSVTLTVVGLQGMIPTSEYDTLVGLFHATAGTGWNDNSNWLDPNSAEWYGIGVTNLEFDDDENFLLNSGNVCEIILETNGLSGTIPGSLNNLTWLETLDLSGNRLSGSIPGFTFLNHLQTLDLSSNQLSGEIPTGFGHLELHLQTLDLSANDLSGAIPYDIYSMPQLETLDLSENQLSGLIELGFMNHLQTLDLHGNDFGGTLFYVGDFQQLQYMDLSVNAIVGTIPVSSGFFLEGSESTLQHLDLSDNELSGPVPAVGYYSQLEYLNLSGNQLSGGIPVGFDALSTLQVLDLSRNQLTNGIPNLGGLGQLQTLNLSDNHLSGPMPPATLLELDNLRDLNLSGNQFTGAVVNLYPLSMLKSCQIQSNDFDFISSSGPPAPSNILAVTNMLDDGIQVIWLPQNPPSVTVNPQNESVPTNKPDPFSVTVEGAPPFAYQWQFNGTNLVDNSRITGSQTTNLSINPVQLTDQGFYQVIVTNAYGSTTSSPAMLTVTMVGIPPQITNQPTTQSATAGGSTVFSVNVTGSTPIAYQWLLNGTIVPGANSATLSITSASVANAGNYSVIVSNSFGMTTNLVGTLSVTTVPVSFATNGAAIQLQSGLVILQIDGLTGLEATIIETSSNLINWIPIYTNSTASGTIQVIDATVSNAPMRFYRITGLD